MQQVPSRFTMKFTLFLMSPHGHSAWRKLKLYVIVFYLFLAFILSLQINTVYMVASGLPKRKRYVLDKIKNRQLMKFSSNHAEQAVRLAGDIYHCAKHYTFPLLKGRLQIRVGIASGPVVAGVIGKKKYAYDCMYGVLFII